MGLRKSFKPTNKIVNGSFSGGTSGWAAGGGDLSTLNNWLSITAWGSYPGEKVTQRQLLAGYIGRRLYCRVLALLTNAVGQTLELVIQEINGVDWVANKLASAQVTPSINTEYTLSGVVNLDASGFDAIDYTVLATYADAGTAANKVLSMAFPVIIDVATLPSEVQALDDAGVKSFCDTIPWFSGTMSGGKIGGIGGLK